MTAATMRFIGFYPGSDKVKITDKELALILSCIELVLALGFVVEIVAGITRRREFEFVHMTFTNFLLSFLWVTERLIICDKLEKMVVLCIFRYCHVAPWLLSGLVAGLGIPSFQWVKSS